MGSLDPLHSSQLVIVHLVASHCLEIGRIRFEIVHHRLSMQLAINLLAEVLTLLHFGLHSLLNGFGELMSMDPGLGLVTLRLGVSEDGCDSLVRESRASLCGSVIHWLLVIGLAEM